MTLTRAEVASYASKAGFSGSDLDIAVAVAKSESGWNPNAHNAKPPDDSYGLWQINMLGSLGPARRKQFGISSNSQLLDPATNARAAHMVWIGSGWKAWTTYTSGAYKANLVDSGGSIAGGVDQATATANPILGVGTALNALGDTFFKVGANIGGIAIAVVLLVLGVLIISKNELPLPPVVKAIGKVVK
jgi:hypothetical protein